MRPLGEPLGFGLSFAHSLVPDLFHFVEPRATLVFWMQRSTNAGIDETTKEMVGMSPEMSFPVGHEQLRVGKEDPPHGSRWQIRLSGGSLISSTMLLT
jgi:hypothetical protein